MSRVSEYFSCTLAWLFLAALEREHSMVIYTGLIYLFLCLAVAYFGRFSRLGFWGSLLVSALLTPVPVFIGLLFFGDRKRPVFSLERAPSRLKS